MSLVVIWPPDVVQTTFPLRSKNVCTTSGGMFLYAKTLHFYLITERYIAQYPLETMFEYNNKLLDLESKVTEEDIKNMTEEEKTKMLLKLLANK